MRRRCLLILGPVLLLARWLTGRAEGRDAGGACRCTDGAAGQGRPFYHAGHDCPRCGRQQLNIHAQGPGRYHTHRHGQTYWYH
jgi:hypothetical protein